MRVIKCVVAAALVAGVSGTAMAQNPTPGVQTAPSSPTGQRLIDSHWAASGFAGSTFGAGADGASFDFGGEVAWLWRGVVGPEFLADFGPSFQLDNLLLANSPNVNSYMANVIVAAPFDEGEWQPYVSAGVGAIQLSSDVFTLSGVPVATALTTTSARQSRLGSNFGGGLMAFGGNVGFRGDIRYYKATIDNNFSATDPVDLFNQSLLSGLDFWRANVGVAFRW